MNRSNCIAAGAGILLLAAAPAFAQAPDYDAIADNLVNQSLAVQPGETVTINGGPSQLDLMAALQVAVFKAGGQALLTLTLPEANKRAAMETSIEHLKQLPTANLMLGRLTDVFINVVSIEDPDLFADVPEERLAAFRQASVPLANAFGAMRFRSATLGQTGGVPTAAYAESVGADPDELQRIFWQAVAVSPDELKVKADRIAALTKDGATVSVTSKEGTNLTFSLDRFPPRINAGRAVDVRAETGPTNVWLPAGEAYAVVKRSTANGTLVVPVTSFRGVPLRNLRLEFENGVVTGMTVDDGREILDQYFAAASPKLKELSVFDIGVNPHSRPPAGSSYLSWEMGGMTSVGLGNNSWAGGDNDADGTLGLHVPGTTVTIDGTEVVRDGRLVN